MVNPPIVGKPLTLDGRSYTVTGVMPETFRLPVADIGGTGTRTDVWLALDPAEDAGAAVLRVRAAQARGLDRGGGG